MCRRFFRGDGAGVEQRLYQRMVFRDLLEFASPQQIDAAIADASDKQFASGSDDEGNRRPHVMVIGIEFAQRHDFGVGEADGLIDGGDGLRLVVGVELQIAFEAFGDEFDRQFAGFFARTLSPHAVRNEKKPQLRVHMKAVLVVLSKVADDADRAVFELNHCHTKGFMIKNGELPA